MSMAIPDNLPDFTDNEYLKTLEEKLGVIHAADLIGKPIPKPEWVVEGFLQKGSFMVLLADGGAGKSWIAMIIAFVVRIGGNWLAPVSYIHVTDFLGLRKTEQMTVVYLDGESDPTDWNTRIQMIANGCGESSYDIIRIGQLDLSQNGELDLLKTYLELIKVKYNRDILLIVDTLSAYKGRMEENSPTEMTAFTDIFKKLCHDEKNGITCLMAHHLNKDGEPRGATAIKNNADTAIGLTRHNDGTITLKVTGNKNRKAQIKPIHLKMIGDEQSMRFEEILALPQMKEKQDTIKEAVLNALKENGELNTKAIYAAVGDSGGRKLVDTALISLKKAGKIREKPGKSTSVLYSLK